MHDISLCVNFVKLTGKQRRTIKHGIKSKELISGKKEILKGLKEINGVDFKQIALDIDSEFGSNGQIQTTLDFE